MDTDNFESGTVIITGASRGIGAEIARMFARYTSFKLLLLARTKEELEKVAEDCKSMGSDVQFGPADLTQKSEIARIVALCQDRYLSGVIHNMGVYEPVEAEATTYKHVSEAMKTNVFPAFEMNAQLLPKIKEQKRGFLFHIGSVAAYEALPRAMAYGMAKHALAGYVKSLRVSVREFGIAVSILHPGNTWSSTWEGSGVDPERLLQPEDIGRMLAATALMHPSSVAEEIRMAPIKGNL